LIQAARQKHMSCAKKYSNIMWNVKGNPVLLGNSIKKPMS